MVWVATPMDRDEAFDERLVSSASDIRTANDIAINMATANLKETLRSTDAAARFLPSVVGRWLACGMSL
jgi:hypothetical protein